MEGTMKKTRLPQSDSIQELATFRDSHDVTDFEENLEEVTQRVFDRDSSIQLHLNSTETQGIDDLAQSMGVSREELIRSWITQQLSRRQNASSG
jgi:predicted urease superfamily metal-dependent hydrolase